jgi:ketosteroid isomerase-like protein
MAMTEGEIRELCNRFFDAYETKDVEELDKIYAPDCVIWHNVFGRDTTRDDNLAAMRADKRQRRRTYDDRIINTFEDGFVIQYTLTGVQHSGHRGALWICIVGLCRDGQLTRVDEYMDSGKFAAWRGDAPRS